MSDAFDRLLDDLTDYLRYQQETGVTAIEAAPPWATWPESRPALDRPETRLAEIAERIAGCTRCRLCERRTRTVPGQGSPRPEIMFVGEGPGAEEDKQGLAFVGKAGELLTRMIAAMGYARDEVFIGNVVKCRPPGNRTPQLDEMETCLPYLKEQIEILQPRVIVALGATALKGLMNDPQLSITRRRGTWMRLQGIDVMPTFHPAYLLRKPEAKRDAWDDLQAVLARLGKEPPPTRSAKT